MKHATPNLEGDSMTLEIHNYGTLLKLTNAKRNAGEWAFDVFLHEATDETMMVLIDNKST